MAFCKILCSRIMEPRTPEVLQVMDPEMREIMKAFLALSENRDPWEVVACKEQSGNVRIVEQQFEPNNQIEVEVEVDCIDIWTGS